MVTICSLAKVAIFSTNVDAENQCLINHKCVCGALNRHFCQTAVMCCLTSHCLYRQPFLLLFRRLWSWLRWIIFCRSTWITGFSTRSRLFNHGFFTHCFIILFFPTRVAFRCRPVFVMVSGLHFF